MLRLFVNTLTADENYSLLNRHNLTQSIHMQLPQKQTFFSEFFSQRLKCTLNSQHFDERDDPHN